MRSTMHVLYKSVYWLCGGFFLFPRAKAWWSSRRPNMSWCECWPRENVDYWEAISRQQDDELSMACNAIYTKALFFECIREKSIYTQLDSRNSFANSFSKEITKHYRLMSSSSNFFMDNYCIIVIHSRSKSWCALLFSLYCQRTPHALLSEKQRLSTTAVLFPSSNALFLPALKLLRAVYRALPSSLLREYKSGLWICHSSFFSSTLSQREIE